MVTLFTTDAWGQAKKEIGGLWCRFRPDHAAVVEADLDQARGTALEAAESGDKRRVRNLEIEWESRLSGLVGADPGAADALARVVAVLESALDGATGGQQKRREAGNSTVTQRVTATGGSAVIQVAGDARIGDVMLASIVQAV